MSEARPKRFSFVRLNWRALLFCEVAAILDWLTTFALLDGRRFVEGNVGAGFLIGTLGPSGFLLFKLVYPPILSGAGAALIRRLNARWKMWTSASVFLVFAGLSQFAAACYNFTLLLKTFS